MTNKNKAALLTTLFCAMFFSILFIIAKLRPGSLVIMAYIFGGLGVIYFIQLLFRWISYDPSSSEDMEEWGGTQ